MVASAGNITNADSKQEPAVKLQVRDVAIHYGSTTAISGINLEIRENEIFGILPQIPEPDE